MKNEAKQGANGFWYKSSISNNGKEFLVAKSKTDFVKRNFDTYREESSGAIVFMRQRQGDKRSMGMCMQSTASLLDPSTQEATTESLQTLFHSPDFVGFETSIYDMNGVLPAHIITKSGKHIGHIGKMGTSVDLVYLLNTDEAILNRNPNVQTLSQYLKKLEINYNTLIELSGVVYAESGYINNNREEKYGIASTCLNVNAKRGLSIQHLSSTLKKISNATFDGNPRYKNFIKIPSGQRNQNSEMILSIEASINAISGGTDYSNNAVGWDGPDLKNNLHTKGFRIHPEHDIFKMGDQPTIDKKNKEYYFRESTAAYGRTIFFKISDIHIKAGGRDY